MCYHLQCNQQGTRERLSMENIIRKLTEEQEKDIKVFAELPEDIRKQLLSYAAGMMAAGALAMKKAG